MADKPIIINNFQKGIAPSAYLGFQEMRGLNITDKPGIVYPNFALTKESSTTITDKIIDSVFDNQGQLWAISAAKLYKRTAAGTWSSITLAGGGSSGTHYGIAFWGATTAKPKGWIFLLAGTVIDVLDLADETTWDKAWESLGGSATNRPTFVASDGKLYMGMGNYNLASLTEDTLDGFAPATSASYTLANNSAPALDLPRDYVIRDINELGGKLMVCAGESGNNDVADIFPWDKSSDSFTDPIRLNEDGDSAGWQTMVKGLLMYIHVGKLGHWYVTNGSSVEEFAEIPETLTALNPASTLLSRNAIAMVNKLIYFAFGSDGSDTAIGVYSLNTKTGSINLEHVISTGTSSGAVEIGGIKSIGNKSFVVMWKDSTTYGADELDTTRYTGDKAFLISQFAKVGTIANPRANDKPEISLAKPLVSGDSLKIWYRTNQGEVWTTYGDPWYSEDRVGFQQGILPAINNTQNAQFKVSLNGATELFEIRIV